MPTFPAYQSNPRVTRTAIGNEAYWSMELVNRIAVKNVTLEDAAQHLRLSLDWVAQVASLIEVSLAAD